MCDGEQWPAVGKKRIGTEKGEPHLATLSVLKFDDPSGAYRVLIALQGLHEREMITLEDATVVSWPEGNNKPKASQQHGTFDVGAISDAFWGFLIGVIFFVPSLGIGTDAPSSPLAEVGIDDDFIRQVREKVTEGTSGLFALTSGVTALEEVVDELKAYDFEILSTSLPEEQEKQLREAFAHEE
jgi:uncharacterized membrane protein